MIGPERRVPPLHSQSEQTCSVTKVWRNVPYMLHGFIIPKGGIDVKLNVKAFALTSALIWGLGLFILTWWIIAFDGITGEPTLIGRFYRGYTVSPSGSVIGLVWASVDGLIGGAIFAWLYNLIMDKFNR